MIVGISSFFNLAGMIGSQVVEAEMEAQLQFLVTTVDQTIAHFQSQSKDAERLAQLAVEYRTMSNQERDFGAVSGEAGRRVVFGMLSEIAAIFEEAATSVNYADLSATVLALPARGEHMRRIIHDPDLELLVRRRDFANLGEALRTDARRLLLLDVHSKLIDTVKIAAAVPVSIRSQQLSPAQRDGVQKIMDATTKLHNELVPQEHNVSHRPADETASSASLNAPLYEVTVYTAILRHWREFIPFVLAAIMIDLVIVPVVLIKMLAYWQRRRDSMRLSVLDRMSASDYLAAVAMIRGGSE